MPQKNSIINFVQTIVQYYRSHGRDMPWRRDISEYSIFVSEIMLQQTQVARVLARYPIFMKAFPNFSSLATSSLTDVLKVWQGMGYNRRAKYLWLSAQEIVKIHRGRVPRDIKMLESLPGIGAATAGSIACFAFNNKSIFIETNIRRSILFHFYPHKTKVDDVDVSKVLGKCLRYIEINKIISFREWYWALMDYGTYLASIVENPNQRSKHYVKQSKFEGSDRQVRGALLRDYLQKGSVTIVSQKERRIWKTLVKEGLVEGNLRESKKKTQ